MTKCYITDPNSKKGFVEVSKNELVTIIGTEEIRPYASKIYRGVISIDEVPENLHEQVQTVVNNRISRFGEYHTQEIPAEELKSMIEEAI